MFALPIRLWRLSLEYPRIAGAAGALAVYLYVGLSAEKGRDLLDLSAVVLSAVEFAMFALTFAAYRDSVAAPARGSRIFGIVTSWLVLDLLATSLWVALARAGIEAYTKLGAPPAFDFSV
jgi:hypothetical protein